MKSLFNFQDPKFNEGFSFDISKLTPEQREHFNKIINARGITQLNDYDCEDKPFAYVDLTEQTIAWYRYCQHPNFLITYPELCRGAVQLEANTFAISNFDKIDSLLGYAASIEMGTYFVNGSDTHILYDHNGLYSSNYHNADKREISPAEFEAKLKGISPVVRETTENQSADNAHPNYYKAIHSDCIVQWISDTDDMQFKGIVIVDDATCEVGDIAEFWDKDSFEPCNYTPNTDVVSQREDFPEVDLPSRVSLADKLHKILEESISENERLEQENAQIKEQVEELTQQVFDLKRLLRNYL